MEKRFFTSIKFEITIEYPGPTMKLWTQGEYIQYIYSRYSCYSRVWVCINDWALFKENRFFFSISFCSLFFFYVVQCSRTIFSTKCQKLFKRFDIDNEWLTWMWLHSMNLIVDNMNVQWIFNKVIEELFQWKIDVFKVTLYFILLVQKLPKPFH